MVLADMTVDVHEWSTLQTWKLTNFMEVEFFNNNLWWIVWSSTLGVKMEISYFYCQLTAKGARKMKEIVWMKLHSLCDIHTAGVDAWFGEVIASLAAVEAATVEWKT